MRETMRCARPRRRARRRSEGHVRFELRFLVLVAAFTGVVTEPSVAWVTRIDGTAPPLGTGSSPVTSVGGSGEVVIAGTVEIGWSCDPYQLPCGPSSIEMVVAKLNGATGAVAWRKQIAGAVAGYARATAVAVDAAGDVIVGGSLPDPSGEYDLAVVKLGGDSGSEAWRYSLDGWSGTGGTVNQLAVDPSGDVVAVGQEGYWPAVVKLSGDSGAERWSTNVCGGSGVARAVAVDRTGPDWDVAVAGAVNPPFASSQDFCVAKLASSDGSRIWDRMFNGTWTRPRAVGGRAKTRPRPLRSHRIRASLQEGTSSIRTPGATSS
jgi:hypothetical protein